jgi:cytochrome b subunit of formate dehydrogenase
MCIMSIGREEKAHRQRAGKGLKMAAVLGTLVLISVAVNGLIIVADAKFRQRSAIAVDCSVMAEQVAAPACHV